MKSTPTKRLFEVAVLWTIVSILAAMLSYPSFNTNVFLPQFYVLYIPCEIVNEEPPRSLPYRLEPDAYSPRTWTHRSCALQKLFLRPFHLGIHGFRPDIRRQFGFATSSDLMRISLIMGLLGITSDTTTLV
jgi:hypothetical protein